MLYYYWVYWKYKLVFWKHQIGDGHSGSVTAWVYWKMLYADGHFVTGCTRNVYMGVLDM